MIGIVLWVITWYAHGRHQPSMDTGVLQAVKRQDDRP